MRSLKLNKNDTLHHYRKYTIFIFSVVQNGLLYADIVVLSEAMLHQKKLSVKTSYLSAYT